MKSRKLFAPFLAIVLIVIATGVFAQEEDDGIVPGPPTNVRVSVVGSALQIQWDPPDENQEVVTGYEIVRSHVPNGLYRKIVHVPRNVLSYRDDTIRPNLRYFYKVRAETEDSYSDYSSPTAAEPMEPQNTK